MELQQIDLEQLIKDAADDSKKPLDENKLGELARLGNRVLEITQAREALDRRMKELGSELYRLTADTIPTLMAELKITDFGLASGHRIELSSSLEANIPTENKINSVKDPEQRSKLAARRRAALAWLVESNHADLIKTVGTIPIGKVSSEVRTQLIEDITSVLAGRNLELQVSDEVHAQTLLAWVRECRAEGISIPEELFALREYTFASIVEPKKSERSSGKKPSRVRG